MEGLTWKTWRVWQLHYSDDLQIYSNIHITAPTKPLDLQSCQLELHLLEEETTDKLAQALSNLVSRVEAQSEESMMGWVNDSPKDVNFKAVVPCVYEGII